MSISICFDDGYKSVYDNAVPLMDGFGFKGTVFVSTEKVGIEDFFGEPTMNLDQLKEIENMGWEIGSHGKTHRVLTSLPTEEREVIIRESKEFLEHHGFRVSSFAYPHGISNRITRIIVSKYYQCGRSVSNPQDAYSLFFRDFDPYFIPTVNFASFQFLRRIKKLDGWLFVLFHSISRSPLGMKDNWIATRKFKDFLNNARNAGLESLTTIDLSNRIRETETVPKLSTLTSIHRSLVFTFWFVTTKFQT